uniref:Uncharacterized protein orf216 n=1 Tax=Pedinomonas minor TaxID=3159 RepID=C7BEQ7_PEDMN|nr:hypothetical protein PrmiC_p057 [Pedinomonas minor]ACQ90898.1 unknown [Pedinomonas minor]
MAILYSFHWEQTVCVYFEENGMTWWPLALILKQWGLSTQTTTVFKQYSIPETQRKRLSDFSTALLSLPKATFFISEQALLNLLGSLETQIPEKKSSIQSFHQFITSPKREQVATKVTSKLSYASLRSPESTFAKTKDVKVVVFPPNSKAKSINQTNERKKLKDIVSLNLKMAEAVNVFLVIEKPQLDYKTREQCIMWANQLQKQLKSCKFTEIEIP